MDCNEQENQDRVSTIWRLRKRSYLIYQTSKPVKCIKITKENLLLGTGQVGAKTGQRFFAMFACVRDCLPNFPITFSPRLQDTFTLYRSKGVETCRGVARVARCCYSLFASYILNISLSMFQWFANVSINCLSHYVIGINAGSEFNMTYLKASRILPLMRPGEPWHYIVCFRFVCPAWYLDTILFRDWYLDKPIWTIWISQFAIVCSCQGQQQLQELLTLNISEVWRQKAMVWKNRLDDFFHSYSSSDLQLFTVCKMVKP